MATAAIVEKSRVNGNGIAFAVVVLLYQVMVCIFYGHWFFYQPITTTNIFDQGQIVLVAFLIILVVVGFGIVNAYITNSSFTGMGMTLLIFVLSLEHFFLIKTFWEKAGTSDPNNSKNWGDAITSKISFVNYGQDRSDASAGTGYAHLPQSYSHHSFVDAIACALANIVAFGSVVGRIKLFEGFFLSLLGTFIYQVNSQLFHRFWIYDTGYGMRIFLFGGFMGLISSIILGRKNTTINHPRYISIYASRGFGLLGLLVIFCTFPCLAAASIFRTSVNRQAVLYAAVLRMYLALIAGVIGSFCACALTYRKMFVHDVVFSAITGGIVYSSSSDLNPNPAVPLTCGFLMSLICTLYHSVQLRKLNNTGVTVSLTAFNRYIIPGFFSGVLSAILMAINRGSSGFYLLLYSPDRTNIGQGGMQMAGVGLSIAIGLFAGIVLGLIYKVINRNNADDQFNDAELFRPDFPPSLHYIDWKQT